MVSKLDFFQKQKGPTNASGLLREHLSIAETSSVRLDNKDRDTILAYMERLDRIQALMRELENDSSADLRAEVPLFETVQKRFFKQGSKILRTIGGIPALKEARPETVSPETHPWWFLDVHLAEQRAIQFQQWRKFGLVVGGILLVLIILFNTVLRPDPAVVEAKARYEAGASLLFQDNDYEGAIAEANAALEARPEDFDALMLKSVALELAGRPKEAELVQEKANIIAPGPEYVLLGRGRIYLQYNDAQRSLELAEEATALNENFAEGFFLLGQAQERLGDIQTAFATMEKASELALEQENDTLYAIIRVNMGYLTNSGGGAGF